MKLPNHTLWHTIRTDQPVSTSSNLIQRLRCRHPIFGSIDQVGPVTPQQAFSIGKTMGEASKEKDNG